MASAALQIKNDSEPRLLAPRCKPGICEPSILVVEDDSGLRRFICALLKWAGAAGVIEASNPYAALSLARRLPRPIDLLISDIELGSAETGIDLAREISASNPWMRVLLISGGRMPQRETPPQWRFLAKPFAIAELLDLVNEALFSVKPLQNLLKNVKNRSAAQGRR